MRSRWNYAAGVLLASLMQVASPALAQTTASSASLERDVRLVSITYSPRSHLHVENLDRIAAYVTESFAATGARVSSQPFTVEGRGYQNVIASFGPEHGERIVVGAHYDAFGPFPGADDNASGVAGLL